MRGITWVALVVLGPYVASRVASPWRQVRFYAVPTSVASDKSTSGALRIASYNIAHGRGTAESNWTGESSEQRMQRLEAIATLLRQSKADIVVLNEVDFDCSWSHGVNQARYLAEQGGYSFCAEQRNLDFRMLFWTWRFGNAILSRHPIRAARVIDLPGYAAWENLFAGKKRGLHCEVEVSRQSLHILGVHLCHRSEPVRAESAQRINQLAQTHPDATLVVGDLNSAPPQFPGAQFGPQQQNALDTFDRSQLFTRFPESPTTDPQLLTFHSQRPDRLIDWILIPKMWSYDDYHVDLSQLSDHRPIWADVRRATER